MVTEVKQSIYKTEGNILCRVYNGAHFSIITIQKYFHGSIWSTVFTKIIFQINHQLTVIYKIQFSFHFSWQYNYVKLFCHSSTTCWTSKNNMAWNLSSKMYRKLIVTMVKIYDAE